MVQVMVLGMMISVCEDSHAVESARVDRLLKDPETIQILAEAMLDVQLKKAGVIW